MQVPDGPSPGTRGSGTTLPCDIFLNARNEVLGADFGQFRDTLNGHFYPARIEALDAAAELKDPRISAIHLPVTTMGLVRFGTTTCVDPGDLAAYHVNVVLSGTVASRCGDQKALASRRVATVFSPGKHTTLPRWNADATQLSIKLPRPRVEEELSALLGRPVVRPIEFQLALPVDAGPGRRWMSLLAVLLATAGDASGVPPRRHLELLERAVISGLLVSQRHSYSDDLATEGHQRAPRGAVDRVVDEILRAPDRGYTLADLARIAGTSARSLQYAFQERFEVSPIQYLRQVRLDCAHNDLAQCTGSVVDVASYWGFTNVGRFARAYRERFGEFPAATLGNARSSASPR